jgi:pyruvate-ferredoxin/flavodoxin oxidoreductase
VKVLAEADAHRGPSLVIAYSHCIEHGIDMAMGMSHQKEAVRSGYWPLWRYVPEAVERGEHPFVLDSKAPSIPLKTFEDSELRFAILARTDPVRAEMLMRQAQEDVNERRHLYEQMAGIDHLHEEHTIDPQDPVPSAPNEEEPT